MKQSTFHVSPFHAAAIEIAESDMTPEEIRTIDRTHEVNGEIKWAVTHGILINYEFRGLPATGKSTTALQLTMTANNAMNRPMKVEYIARDQTEFTRIVKDNPELNNVCIEIDEYNALENTGFNSTTESAFLNYFSDVQAQRFIHRIACSPQDQVDKNSYIIFETVSMDTETQTTRCLIYYRYSRGDHSYPQLIGKADIDVSAVLASKWYKTYVERKFKKMDLVTKEGVRSPKELEYAQIILDIYERLKPVAKLGLKDAKTIKLALRAEAIKKKQFLSIIGERDIIESVESLLQALHKLDVMRRKVIDAQHAYKRAPSETLLKEVEMLQLHYNDIQLLQSETLDYWKHLLEVHEQYKAIDNED